MSDETTPIYESQPEAVPAAPAMPTLDQVKGLAEKTLSDIDTSIAALKNQKAAIESEIRDLNVKRIEAARILGAMTPRKPRTPKAEKAPKVEKAPKPPKSPKTSA